LRPNRRSTLKQLGFSSYDEYLRSDLWAANRKRLKLAARCWCCGSFSNLHHHHTTYANIGNEQPGDLVVLCQKCHRGVHNFVTLYKLKLEKGHLAYKKLLETGERPKRAPRKKGKKLDPAIRKPNKTPRGDAQKRILDVLKAYPNGLSLNKIGGRAQVSRDRAEVLLLDLKKIDRVHVASQGWALGRAPFKQPKKT
jgi:hypothetical protein